MNALTGTGTLVRLILRRDRVRLPVWVLAILSTVAASAQAVQGLYATPGAREVYATTIGSSPASVAMSGPSVALHTIGGVTVFEVNTTATVAIALMAVFLVVRHTRAEEEVGRTELFRAAVLGLHAPLAASLLVVGCASLLVGAGVAASFVSLGLPTSGSLVYGASTAATGLVFTAVGAVAAQLTQHARGALGIAGAVLGVSFVLRAIGDVGNEALTWMSPIGWSQAVHAFDTDRWWPLGFSVLLVVLLTAVAVVLVERRDVGAGLVPTRPGPAQAAPRLSSPFGLSVRLQRGSIIGWTTGIFLGGAAFGSLGREVTDLVEGNPTLKEYLPGGGADLVDAFFGTALLMLGLMAAGFTISSVLRLRGEEVAGRAEPLLTTGTSRRRWALDGLVVTLLGTVVVIAAGGLGVGLTHGLTTGDAAQVPRLLGASLVYVPATLLLGAGAMALFGWLPRWTAAVWGALAGSFVIGWLGGLIDFPTWVVDLSPFSHVPAAPMADVAWVPLLVLSGLVVALVSAGLVGLGRRDVA